LRAVAEALDLPPESRAEWVAGRFADPARRAAAEKLLRACEQAAESPVLDTPAAQFAAPILAEIEHQQAAIPQQLETSLAGRYTIERELGRGGQATVYLARDERHGRPVALKVLHPPGVPDDGPASGAARFQREIEFAARLSHPHILPLYDSGAAGGRLYYITPYVDGESLRDRLARAGRLPLSEALRILRDVARALAHAHRQGLVHRDIKPGNILLNQEGDALVSDFGVAKALAAAARPGSAEDVEVTDSALVLGTPAYMAPEQAAGGSEVNHRADLYSFGVVAYELLTGATPFAGRSRHEVVAAHLAEAPEPVAGRQPEVPAPLAALVDRLLAKRPGDRPRDATEVLSLLDGAMTSRPATASRRRRLVAAAAALLIAGGAVAVATGRTPGGVTAEHRSIAVLPFTNTSATLDDAAFSDGLTDELIGALSKVSELEVAARTSAVALKRQNLSVAAIGDRLGVATVLEGGVRREGERLRVTTNLIGARDSRVLWSETYNVPARDRFALQERIARDVIAALAPRLAERSLPARLVERGTENLEAYDLYRKGRVLVDTRQRDGLLRALRYFEQAAALDTAYARAYAGIADVYTFLAIFGHARPRDVMPKSRVAAERAIAHDSLLAEAHAVRAHQLVVYQWDWRAAGIALERAIALDPRYPQVRMYYASYLHSIGRPEDALAQLNVAQQLDPLTPTGLLSGRVYVDTRQPDAAIRVLQELVELEPRRDLAHQLLAHAYLQKRMPAEAIASMRRAAALSGPRDSAQLAYIYAATGDHAAARRVLDRLLGRGTPLDRLGFHVAMAYAGLGKADEAFRWLEAAYEERAGFMNLLAVTTGFEAIRSDPRFGELLQRMGLDGVSGRSLE
jgi:serine/threonine-protein kinase